MDQSKTMKFAFWRGAMLGPLAVFPATVLAAFMNSILNLDSMSFAEAMQFSLMISLWGICIAYLAVVSFGAIVWFALWKVRCLSLLPLLVCSIIPAAVLVAFTKDITISLIVAYYSLAVCFMAWFVGLRNVPRL